MGKTKGARALFKKRRATKKRVEAETNRPESSTAGFQALQYLREWTNREESGWKFNKTRQTYLLKSWPHRDKVPGDEFKQLLQYMLTLPAGSTQRTIEQARSVAEEAERQDRAEGEAQAAREAVAARREEDGDDADEDGDDAEQAEAEASAERRALLKIKRARALKVLQTLMAATEAVAS